MAEKLEAIDRGDEHLKQLGREAEAAKQAYLAAAQDLSAKRRTAAVSLDKAVNAELPPLKLEKARFETRLAVLEAAEAGPLGRIASAGELSRFLLALKLVLASASPVATLVFDEVDSGVGGATAAAVGERLARLARERQVLVVTHSPQVAARGERHWHVQKQSDDVSTLTQVQALDEGQRREEIARMLSGAEITEAARAAADQLMDGA